MICVFPALTPIDHPRGSNSPIFDEPAHRQIFPSATLPLIRKENSMLERSHAIQMLTESTKQGCSDAERASFPRAPTNRNRDVEGMKETNDDCLKKLTLLNPRSQGSLRRRRPKRSVVKRIELCDGRRSCKTLCRRRRLTFAPHNS